MHLVGSGEVFEVVVCGEVAGVVVVVGLDIVAAAWVGGYGEGVEDASAVVVEQEYVEVVGEVCIPEGVLVVEE